MSHAPPVQRPPQPSAPAAEKPSAPPTIDVTVTGANVSVTATRAMGAAGRAPLEVTAMPLGTIQHLIANETCLPERTNRTTPLRLDTGVIALTEAPTATFVERHLAAGWSFGERDAFFLVTAKSSQVERSAIVFVRGPECQPAHRHFTHASAEEMAIRARHNGETADLVKAAASKFHITEFEGKKVIDELIAIKHDQVKPSQDLERAVASGTLETVQALVLAAHGEQDLAGCDFSNGASLIALAARQDRPDAPELIDYLKSHGLGLAPSCGPDPMMEAVRNNRVGTARKLLELDRNFVNPRRRLDSNEFSETPIHAAIEHGLLEMANLLIDGGADLTVQLDDRGRERGTPLEFAAGLKGTAQMEILRALLRKTRDTGARALERAIDASSSDAVAILLQNDPDQYRNLLGTGTLLCVPAQRGALDLVEALVKGGGTLEACPNISSILQNALDEGLAPIVQLAFKSHPDLPPPECRDVIRTARNRHWTLAFELLKRGGVDFDCDFGGLRLVTLAAVQRNLEVLEILHKVGPQLDFDSAAGTPLNLAIRTGADESVKKLLGFGASPNTISSVFLADKNGNTIDWDDWGFNPRLTPLMHAVRAHRLDYVKLLCDNHADANASIPFEAGVQKTMPGTALAGAIYEGQPEIAAYLIESCHADVNQYGLQVSSRNGLNATIDAVPWPPLLHAISRNDIPTLRLLLDKQANPNVCASATDKELTRSMASALQYATALHNDAAVALLTEHGAKPKFRCNQKVR